MAVLPVLVSTHPPTRPPIFKQVRGRALAEGVPKGQLSSRQLTAALLEMGQEDSSPLVVFLMDKGSAVLKNRGVCHR